MKSLDLERLYRKGFKATDFGEVLPNLLVLEPLRRPELMGGIKMVGDDPRFEALIFRVVAHGLVPGPWAVDANPLRIALGDIITIRNALAEPIQPDRGIYIVDVKYAWSVVQRAAEAEEQLLHDAEVEAKAAADIQATRQALVRS